MEGQTFSGSRHLAKYCAYRISECSFTSSFCVQVIDKGHSITSGGDPKSLVLCIFDFSVVGVVLVQHI